MRTGTSCDNAWVETLGDASCTCGKNEKRDCFKYPKNAF